MTIVVCVCVCVCVLIVCNASSRLYVWEFAYKHDRLWSYTNKALPSNVKKDSMTDGNKNDGGAPTKRPDKVEDPQTLAFLAISRYMENSLTSVDSDLVKQKQSLEVEALQLAKEKQMLEVEMLKKANDSAELNDLLNIISNPKISDEFRAKMEDQVQELYAKKRSRSAAGLSTNVGESSGANESNAMRFM